MHFATKWIVCIEKSIAETNPHHNNEDEIWNQDYEFLRSTTKFKKTIISTQAIPHKNHMQLKILFEGKSNRWISKLILVLQYTWHIISHAVITVV